MGRKKKSEHERLREEALASFHEKERRWKKEKEREQQKKNRRKRSSENNINEQKEKGGLRVRQRCRLFCLVPGDNALRSACSVRTPCISAAADEEGRGSPSAKSHSSSYSNPEAGTRCSLAGGQHGGL